jgi:hypothetical protein
MPITQCPKHGETGIVEMCEHLSKKLNKGIYQPFFEVPVQTTRLCLSCFDKYKIKDLLKSMDVPTETIKELRKKLKGTDEIEQNKDWYDAVLKHPDKKPLKRVRTIYRKVMKTRGWKCVDCIDRIYIDYARKNNLQLPFEPFENTLFTDMYNDKRVLDLEKRLDKILNPDNVHFTKHDKDYRIYSGSYRKLFTIEIFGAESEQEQQDILKTMEDFYKKRKQKQRKVIFHTKWVRVYDEEEKRDRLEADVLSEVVVK